MQVPEPPAAYASTTGTTVEGGNATPTATPTTRSTETSDARRRFNLWVGLGIGDAVGCGNEDPDSLCAVDGAFTFTVAGDFRFYPNFSVGLELAFWGYAVNDEWRGQLAGAPDKAEIASFFLAAFGRWYWFDKGIVDPYLQLGLGVGGISGTVSNMTDSYTYAATGVVPHLALGVDFHVHRAVRIGPQFLTALQLGNRVCETIGDEEMCRDPEKNAKGEREGNLLAWRFMLVGTIMLGER